jgi:hypothetical protein
MKTLAFIITISLLFAIESIENTASAQSVDCAGISGAAFGLCLAAQASECDGSETDSKGCDKIELRFEEMTGTTPPWTLADCPCGNTADFITHIQNSGARSITCSVSAGVNDLLSIDDPVNMYDNVVFTHLPPINTTSKHTCGFDNTSMMGVDSEQALSCANNIVAAAVHYNEHCVGYDP